jgi:hypothetical protein
MEEFGSAIEIEDRITNAEEKYFDGNFASLRAAATKYHVPYSRLYTRQHNQPSKIGQPGPNKRLNPEKEAFIRLYTCCYDTRKMRNRIQEGRSVTKTQFDWYMRGAVAQSLALPTGSSGYF